MVEHSGSCGGLVLMVVLFLVLVVVVDVVQLSVLEAL